MTISQRLPAPTGDRGTMIDLLDRNVEMLADQPAITDAGSTLTWGEYGDMVRALSLAFHELGIRRGDAIGIHQRNRAEHITTDTAAMLLGAVGVSLYNTLSPEQLQFIASDIDMRLLVVEAHLLPHWLPILDGLPHRPTVIVVDGDLGADSPFLHWADVIDRGRRLLSSGDPVPAAEAREAVGPDDTVTLIYTSGTTGPPKGVLFSHRGTRFTVDGVTDFIRSRVDVRSDRDDPTSSGSRLLSYLPLAHAADRFTGYYLALRWGAHIHFVRDLDRLATELPSVKPSFFLAVPRVWEKFGSGMRSKLAAGGAKAALGNAALNVATHVGQCRMEGRRPGLALRAQHALFERLLYPRFRQAMGLDRCALAVSGAAPIDSGLLCLFTGIGIPIAEGYGMTETGALATLSSPTELKPGSVGKPFHKDVSIRIADDGEIMVRGPGITPGYHNRPDATAEAIDADGWLHTGDLGELDADGSLRVTGRKKELIITSGGKNISPNAIETAIKSESPLIAHVMAIGDRRKYISALIVPDPDGLATWAQQTGLPDSTFAELARHKAVHDEVARAVAGGNKRLAKVEQVKRFAIIDEPWLPTSPELTPTLKLRRSIIVDLHRDTIESLYESGD